MTEISQIVLILLDSRCPLLHYPPSLAAYLSTPHFVARKRTILVLTKVDIAGPERADAWTKHLNARYPELRVVQVESYSEKSAGRGAGGRRLYEPHLPSAFRQTLVDALRDTHADLLRPPEKIRDVPEKVKAWKPPVKREVDWEAVLNAQGGQVGSVVGGAAAPRPRNVKSTEGEDARTDLHENEATNEHEVLHPDEDEDEPEFLTIGLIGKLMMLSTRHPNIPHALTQANPTSASPRFSMHCSAHRKPKPLTHLERSSVTLFSLYNTN